MKKLPIQQQGITQSERGAVSVLVIMVLLLFTIAGIASLYTARTEIQIAGNESNYVSALSASDAALNEAAQRLIHSSRAGALLDENAGGVHRSNQGNREGEMTTFIGGFMTTEPGTAPATATATHTDIGPDTYYSAIYWGRAQGSSLDVTELTPLKGYTLYGIYNECLGEVVSGNCNSPSRLFSLVESGYRNR